MDLKIYSAHTGQQLRVPYNVNSLPELKRWIASELGITEKYLVLMTPRGAQVKAQYWADQTEIFAFDRELLSRRTSTPTLSASSSTLDLPSIPPPPDTSTLSSRSPLATHISHLRSRAAWARNVSTQAQEINTRIDRLNNEITVLQTSAKIALVNLGNVSRRVQRAFTDAETLAEKKLEVRRLLLERIPRAVNALETVEIHAVFGRKEETLGELFERENILRAREVCLQTNEDVDRRVRELKDTMEEFILRGEALKTEVLAWEPQAVQEGGQAREIQLITDKIEREMTNQHTAISSSTRSFQNHTREYIPNIQSAMQTLLQTLKSAHFLRQSVKQKSHSYLQRLSTAQEKMVSIGPQLEEADALLNASAQDYASLQGIEGLARGYGEALLEGFRRGLWKLRRAKRLERTKQEIALLRAHERRARKAWADNTTSVEDTGIIQWTLTTELSDDDTDSPGTSSVNGDSSISDDPNSVSRKEIEKYISTLSKSPLFTPTTETLKEHLSILLTSLQSAQIEVGTSPLQHSSSEQHDNNNNLPPLKTREGSEIYEQLLQDKSRAEEKARNFESRVKNLEEMLHRQFRTPPRNFSPVPAAVHSGTSASTSPQPRSEGVFEEPLLGRSIHGFPVDAQKRIAELEAERDMLVGRLGEVEGTKNDLMANLEEQTKLFQLEREDLLGKQHELERELERRDADVERVEKMEEEMDVLRKGRQTLLREMNLLQMETGAKIRELEEAKAGAEQRVASLEENERSAAAKTERITVELRKASVAADDAIVELEKFRRMSDEHKAEREKLDKVVEELRDSKGIISQFEAEKTTIQAGHVAELNALRQELGVLRDGIVASMSLEKRKWETESLVHAIRQKAASKDQHATESDATIATLTKEKQILSAQLAKSKALCASRTLKARDLTQRLYTHHTRCRQLLETLGLQAKSTTGSPLRPAGTSHNSTDYLEPDDLDLLYWMESGDSDEEADKYSRYLGRIVIDIDAFCQGIKERVKDAEKYAKKWQKEARAYRDKAKHYQHESEMKIAFRGFKDGDLALFLPTNNGRPWAAFNVNAPHYFLRENEAHRLGGGRDWLLARITKVEERTVDLSGANGTSEDHNPFGLADGLRWYFLDAAEEKPSTIASRELARSMALQKSELRRVSSSGIKGRMTASTPGLSLAVAGREEAALLPVSSSAIQEEGEEGGV